MENVIWNNQSLTKEVNLANLMNAEDGPVTWVQPPWTLG